MGVGGVEGLSMKVERSLPTKGRGEEGLLQRGLGRPSHRTRKAGDTHPTGMLSCYYYCQ